MTVVERERFSRLDRWLARDRLLPIQVFGIVVFAIVALLERLAEASDRRQLSGPTPWANRPYRS